MSAQLNQLLFAPKSIVVYGASTDPNKLSGRPLAYLRSFGYPGEIIAINPRRDEVQGVPTHASMAASGRGADLAVIVVPQSSVIDALRDCAEAGVKAAIVFASGFGEVDEAGRTAEAEITDLAKSSGMRIIGPNCLGTFSIQDSTFATFSTAFDESAAEVGSPIALVTQSGAVGTFAYSEMGRLGIGVRVFANTGNESDVDVVELLESLLDHPEVNILMGHFENGVDVERVRGLARASRIAGKPLLIIKGGRTPAGARAVGAHTGSAAGDFAAFRSAVEGEGGIVVTGLADWVDTVQLLLAGRRPTGGRLSILTQSGGSAALAVDEAMTLGLAVDTWTSAEDRAAIDERLPGFASTLNPIDLTGAMLTDPASLRTALGVAAGNEQTDAVGVVLGNSDRTADVVTSELIRAYRETEKAFFVSWTGGNGRARELLRAADVPTYNDPTAAVRALARVVAASGAVKTAEANPAD